MLLVGLCPIARGCSAVDCPLDISLSSLALRYDSVVRWLGILRWELWDDSVDWCHL